MLKDGTYTSAAEIAEAEGVTRSFINRLLRLTLLAPDIQEAILEGRQPKVMQVEDLTRSARGTSSANTLCPSVVRRPASPIVHPGSTAPYRNIPTVALSLNGDCRGRQPRGAVIQEPGSGAERAGRALDIRR
jgi:hypothetical protein